MTEQLLTVNEVARKLRFSRAWVYRQVRLGKLPAPLHLGSHSRWRESEIDAWIRAEAERQAAA